MGGVDVHTNHGFNTHKLHNETNKRKERDQPVEKMTRKKTKNLDGVDVHIHPHRRGDRKCEGRVVESSILVLPIMPSPILCVGRSE